MRVLFRSMCLRMAVRISGGNLGGIDDRGRVLRSSVRLSATPVGWSQLQLIDNALQVIVWYMYMGVLDETR